MDASFVQVIISRVEKRRGQRFESGRRGQTEVCSIFRGEQSLWFASRVMTQVHAAKFT
jgi:hypothetical protein